MDLSTFPEWLGWIERAHPKDIELGLERVKTVAETLGLLAPPCPIIIVGGTNGKGSTVIGLESIYRAAHYRTCAFISPYLHHYCEQIRIDGGPVSETALCHAFGHIEAARGQTLLTAFEWGTLAALLVFKQHLPDVLLLEVGLGGRLDAVNILDADVAVITSIGIDHVDWLGETREKIGREKAGIFRPHRPAVCGDASPPKSILETAACLGAPLYVQKQDFVYQEITNHHWSWKGPLAHYADLPRNGLLTQNMATALMAITLLQSRLPVSSAAIKKGLVAAELSGRIQWVKGPVTLVLDVAHNPAAIALLLEKLREAPCSGRTYAVFSMLADKDIGSSVRAISEYIDGWYTAPLQTKRAATMSSLQAALQEASVQTAAFFPTIGQAYEAARKAVQTNDRIVIFGSFHTVAAVQEVLNAAATLSPRAHIST
jgi:dihydrofolate synthase/folylpolyglutamate synthase